MPQILFINLKFYWNIPVKLFLDHWTDIMVPENQFIGGTFLQTTSFWAERQ